MIRRLLVLAATGLGLAALAERLLAAGGPLADLVGGDPTSDPIVSRIRIAAPQGLVWRALSDIPSQPLWMREMKAVRLEGDGPVGVGTRGEADVRIAGITVTDPVEVVTWEPPVRFGIRHVGLFTGGGEIVLSPALDGTHTDVVWEERLIPPVFPRLGALVQRPILGSIFQGDLELLRDLVESGELPRRDA